MPWEMIPPAEWVENEQQLGEIMNYFYNAGMQGELICYDTETTGLDITRDLPVMASFSDGKRRVAMWAEYLRHPWIAEAIFKNPRIVIGGTNLKFDRHMTANYGVEMVNELEDTLVQDWLVNENRLHGLKETAWDHCGIKMLSFTETWGKAKKGEDTGAIIRRVMATPDGFQRGKEYAGLDAFASRKVRDYLVEQMSKIEMRDGLRMDTYYRQWEMPFTRVLWNLERRGFTIGVDHLRSQLGPMADDMLEIETQLAQWSGWPVNLQSPMQLSKLFFQQLQCPIIKFTDGTWPKSPTEMQQGIAAGKSPSTDDEVMETIIGRKYQPAAEFAKLIQQYRKTAKIKGTYVAGLLKRIDPDLRLHTTLRQQGTVTGRLSSSDPNLQNIPKPKTDSYKIRNAFIAKPGKRLIVADYDQLEMKIMAHFSGDEKMIQAIRSGKDLHCATVENAKGIPYDTVYAAKKASDNKTATPEQLELVVLRDALKAVGFGIIYGEGEVSLGKDLGMTVVLTKGRNGRERETCPEAAALIHGYLNQVYPGVGRFIKSTHEYCRRTEYVQTFLGRFRRLPGINAGGDNSGIAAEARRQSVNTIIQGTAADIAKAAMLRAEYDPVLADLGAEMLLQIHDELIFEVDDKPDIVDAAKARVKQIMEEPFPGFQFQVPLTAAGGSGYCWTEAK